MPTARQNTGRSAEFVKAAAATATINLLELSVTGDTNPRYVVNADGSQEWGPGNAATDTGLLRDAANTLALRNGGTAGTPVPQTFRVYNWHDGTDAEYLEMKFDSNIAIIRTAVTAGGTVRALNLRYGNTTALAVGVPALSTSPVELAAVQTGNVASSGRVAIGLNGFVTATSGTNISLSLVEGFQPSASSTMDARSLQIAPTINYAGGGAGRVQLIRLDPTNTALPTGNNGAIVLSKTAADGLGGIHLYNTADETTNYERGAIYWDLNGLFITTSSGGTGVSRDILLQSDDQLVFRTNGANNRWIVQAAGDLTCGTDNAFDIGAIGANRPANVYVATSVQVEEGFVRVAGSTTAKAFFEFDDGATVPVSAAGEARLRYNDTAKELQASIDGGAFAAIGGGGSGGAVLMWGGNGGNVTSVSFVPYALFSASTRTPGFLGSELVAPRSGTLKNLWVQFLSNQSAGDSHTVEIFVNGTGTGIKVICDDVSPLLTNNSVDTAVVAEGDLIEARVTVLVGTPASKQCQIFLSLVA